MSQGHSTMNFFLKNQINLLLVDAYLHSKGPIFLCVHQIFLEHFFQNATNCFCLNFTTHFIQLYVKKLYIS